MARMITLKEMGRPFFVLVNADAISYIRPYSADYGSTIVFDHGNSLAVEDAPIDILSKISTA
jgi:hypothetical protein